MSLEGKKVIVGISGGIAAYKICELVRLYKKSGAEVRVVMTPSALHFVSPITLSALSGNEVLINLFPDLNDSKIEKVETKTWHIYSGMWADVMVVAPATANTISKLVYGASDNYVTTTVLAARCPVIVAPSMDEDMLINEVTASNISALKEFGFWVMEPESGELASGLVGKGRMPEPESIFKFTDELLSGIKQDLAGKKVLVTAGPTYEPIDAVRFIGNYSSGKMGFQLAKAASQRGADVTLISGPSMLKTPRHVKRIDIQTAADMFDTVKSEINGKDIIIMSAAVSDYKPVETKNGKIKKTSENLVIETEKTIDILEYLGKNKTGYKLVGFALETDNGTENAKEKLKNKNLDVIVLNNPQVEGAGFGTDTNVATIIDKNNNITELEKMSKFELSNIILDKVKDI